MLENSDRKTVNWLRLVLGVAAEKLQKSVVCRALNDERLHRTPLEFLNSREVAADRPAKPSPRAPLPDTACLAPLARAPSLQLAASVPPRSSPAASPSPRRDRFS